MESIFEVRRSDELGRFLVAARDIPARTLLIKEKPLACAPADDDRGSTLVVEAESNTQQNSTKENDLNDNDTRAPMCLGCFTRQTNCPQSRCDLCHWPICHPSCSQLPNHADNECKLFRKNCTQYPPPHTWPILYKSILVLRSYLLKSKSNYCNAHQNSQSHDHLQSNLSSIKTQTQPNSYNDNDKCNSEIDSDYVEIMKFENHNDLRWKKPDSKRNDHMILENIRYFFKNQNPKKLYNKDQDQNENPNPTEKQQTNLEIDFDSKMEIDETEIFQLSGIINVNAFTTLKETQKGQVAIIQCLFKLSTLISHSCVPNSTWTIGDGPDFKMSIRSAIPILKGQMITIAYSVRENLSGTLQRLVSTEDVAHFTCHCPRCVDPTELGTMVSAVKCGFYDEQKDQCQCPGYLLPINPTDPTSVWRCSQNQNQKQNQNQGKNENHCQFSLPVQKIVRILCRVENQLENIRSNYELRLKQNKMKAENKQRGEAKPNENENKKETPNLNFLSELESLRKKCQEFLHENHYLIQEISLNIVKRQAALFSNSDFSSDFDSTNSRIPHSNLKTNSELNEEQVQNFVEHCEFLLKIANVTSPGYCRHRAILQFYLSRGLHRKAILYILKSKELTNLELLEHYQKILDTFKAIDEFEREAFLYFKLDGEVYFESDEFRDEGNEVEVGSGKSQNCKKNVNSNNLYFIKLAEQMEVTQKEIQIFQNLIQSIS